MAQVKSGDPFAAIPLSAGPGIMVAGIREHYITRHVLKGKTMATLEEFLAKAGDAPVLVSACLLGLSTRYDGGTAPNKEVIAFAKTHRVVPICPEQLGGLTTPRAKSSLTGGDGAAVLKGRAKVRSESGREVTENFLRGGKLSVSLARMTGARFAILKEKSPSCGVLKVYVDGELVDGCGVTTAALKSLGIEIFVVP